MRYPARKDKLELSEAVGFFDRFARALEHMRHKPTLRDMLADIRADIQKNFDQEKSPDGIPWIPAKPSAAKDVEGKLLRDKGLLLTSLVSPTSDHGHHEVTDNSLLLTTNVPHAKLHQKGGVIKPKKAKALAIPWSWQARAAGSPRNMSNLRMIWEKGMPRGWLVTRGEGEDVKTNLHFLLVTSVEIPAREFIGIGKRLYNQFERTIFKNIAHRVIRGF